MDFGTAAKLELAVRARALLLQLVIRRLEGHPVEGLG